VHPSRISRLPVDEIDHLNHPVIAAGYRDWYAAEAADGDRADRPGVQTLKVQADSVVRDVDHALHPRAVAGHDVRSTVEHRERDGVDTTDLHARAQNGGAPNSGRRPAP
jgi:hypothetical protein